MESEKLFNQMVEVLGTIIDRRAKVFLFKLKVNQ